MQETPAPPPKEVGDRGLDRQRLLDTVLTAGWLALGGVQLLFPNASALWDEPVAYHFRAPDAVASLLVIAVCVPLWFRRRYPATAFAVAFSALGGLVVGDYMVGVIPFVCWILIYAVGAYATRRRIAATVGVLLVVLLVAWYSNYSGEFGAVDVVRNAVLLSGCLLAGMFAAAIRRNARTQVELAEQRAVVASQRTHAAIVEERLRLAQELHDIVAHSMSVISVQASMGSAAFDRQPEQTRRALDNIEQTSRQALSELRGLLGVLRHDDGSRGELSPAPSLRNLRHLTTSLESAGITTTVTVVGPLTLPPGADAFSYRIVQEATTNVMKHAHASKVSIEINDDGQVATLQVRDDGVGHTGRTAAGEGHGILGMKERVATFGGTLRAGPVPGGGFDVYARIPYANVPYASVPSDSVVSDSVASDSVVSDSALSSARTVER